MPRPLQDKPARAIEGEITEGIPTRTELPDLPLPDIEIPVPTRARDTLTEARVTRFLEAVSLGATHLLAASYAGMSKAAMERWIERIPELKEAVEAAEAIAALRWLRKIEDAIEAGTWQAAAWKLERLYPDIYGRRDMRNMQPAPISGPTLVESPPVIQQARTTVEQWREQRKLNSPGGSLPPETSRDTL